MNLASRPRSRSPSNRAGGTPRLCFAVLLSIALHALLLALEFGIPGAGLPSLEMPWQKRSAELPPLAVQLTPASESLPPPALPPTPSQPPLPSSALPPPTTGGLRLLDPVAQNMPAAPELAATPQPAQVTSQGLPRPASTKVITQEKNTEDSFFMPVDEEEPEIKTTQNNLAVEEKPPGLAQAAPVEPEPPATTAVTEKPQEKPLEKPVEKPAVEESKPAEESPPKPALRQALRAEPEKLSTLPTQSDVNTKQLLEQAAKTAASTVQQEVKEAEAARLAQQAKLEKQRALDLQAAAQKELERRAKEAEERAQRDKQQQELARQEKEQQEKLLEQQRLKELAEQTREQERQRQLQQEKRAQEVAEQAKREQAQREQAQREQAQREQEQRDQAERARLAQAGNPAAGKGNAEQPGNNAGGSNTRPGAALSNSGDLASRARDMLRQPDILRPPQPARDAPLRRRSIFGSLQQEVPVRMYVEAWQQKIERNGRLNYSQRAAERSRDYPVVTVVIRSDGSVEDITIHHSSGRADIDEAVRRIIMVNAPYAAFPPNMALRYDVIEIRRIWRFDEGIRLLEELR